MATGCHPAIGALDCAQVKPKLVEMKIGPLYAVGVNLTAATSTPFEDAATPPQNILGRLACIHVTPVFVEKKTHPSIDPAIIVIPSADTANESQSWSVGALDCAQVVPALVET